MKKDARSLTPSAQEVLRQRAVKAIEDGMTQVRAAEVFAVTRQAIGKWIVAYRKAGISALKARKRGPKSAASKLKGWQAATVCNIIRDRHPEQAKLPFALWTSNAVKMLIHRKFGIKVSARSVRRYLRAWGFTPQKPKRVAYERNPVAVKRWLEEEYPSIRNRAKREGALIYWGDEMGMRSDHQAGRSYSPRGKTPVRPGTGQRFSCNMISALTNRGHLAFMIFKTKFTANVFIQFMRRLMKESKRKVFLIVDGHPVHRSAKAAHWLKKNMHRIEIFRLPAYSPDLNPDECLNQDVKTNAIGRKSPRTRLQMIQTVRNYLRRRRSDPEIVRRYFREDSVRYAAA